MDDLDSLQQALSGSVTNSVNSGIQDQLGKLIAWVVVLSIILTVIILVLYILHMLRRRKLENAIFEIRDTLRDMKLAQVSHGVPAAMPEAPQTKNSADTTTPAS